MLNIRSAGQPAHTNAVSTDRKALLAFVDACQVLVGRVEPHKDELTDFVRELLMRVLRRAPRPSINHATTNFRVARVLSYLEEKFADPTIRLACAAKQVEVTPSHLDRLLKEHTGLTFLQQLRRIRLCHAERLLLTTTSSIKETAYACGYTSTGAFGRDFRRVHRCAPREWRQARTLCPQGRLDEAS